MGNTLIGNNIVEPFSPLDISGLQLWLKSTDGITESSLRVSAWADQSGNSNNVTQSEPTDQPFLITDNWNRPAISFGNSDSEDTFMVVPAGVAVNMSTGHSVFAVSRTYKEPSVNPIINFTGLHGVLGHFTRVLFTRGGGSNRLSTQAHNHSRSVVGFTADSTGVDFYTETATDSASAVSGSNTAGWVGRWNSDTSSTLSGDIYEILVFNRKLSAVEATRIVTYLASKYHVLPVTTKTVIEGDSIALGTGSTHNCNIPAHINFAGLGITTWAHGTSSDTWVDIDADLSTLTSTHLDAGLSQNRLLVICGSNDLVTQTANTVISRATSYAADAKTDGWDELIFCTVLPRNNITESVRVDYNNQLVALAGGNIDKVVDVRDDADIGAAGANTNLSFYDADQIHPNSAGYAKFATLIAATL